MKKILFILAISTLLISCDHFVNIKGKIVDYGSGKPIRNAKITIWHKELYSDSLGCFSYERNTGRSIEIKMRVEKQGYKPFVIRYKKGKENYYFIKNSFVKNPKKYILSSISTNSTSFNILKDSINIKLERTQD
jgi:hypothetical protein